MSLIFILLCLSPQGRRKRGGWGGLGRPTFLPLTPFDYERAGGLHQQSTTRTLPRCIGSVELLFVQ